MPPSKYAPLDNRVYCFQNIGIVEFQRPCHDQSVWNGRIVQFGEIHQRIVPCHGKSLRIRLDVPRYVRGHHPPLLAQQGIYIGIQSTGIVDDESLIGVVIDDSAFYDELLEGNEIEMVSRETSLFDQLLTAGERGQRHRLVIIQHIRNAHAF